MWIYDIPGMYHHVVHRYHPLRQNRHILLQK